jgi:hypothetical protein
MRYSESLKVIIENFFQNNFFVSLPLFNIIKMSYTNHSGGAKGSDSEWDRIGRLYGVTDHRHYWHRGLSKPPLGNIEISEAELDEGWEKVKIANKVLKRKPQAYKSLLSRNWFQVKHSEAVFAIGYLSFDDRGYAATAEGGTGWAVQMAIDCGKGVYFFDQKKEKWFKWNRFMFAQCDTPTLTKNFAGIGTRKIDENGKRAIKEVYEKTMKTA